MTPTDEFIGIAGASGQLGMLAAAELMRRIPPSRVALLSRTPERLADFAARGVQVRACDFDSVDALPKALEGISSLLLISTGDLGRRVQQHEAAIAAARAAGVKRILYTSFLGAEPDNPALVARDHCATERALRESGLDWTILRHAQYADAILDVIVPNALASGTWISSSGDGRIAPVARSDCAACAAAALLRPDAAGKTYNITGPDLLTYRDMAAMAAAQSGRSIRFTPVDDTGLYGMFDALGAPRSPRDVVAGGFPWCSDDMVSFEAALREGWFAVQSGDAGSLMGRPPRAFADLLNNSLRARKETAAS